MDDHSQSPNQFPEDQAPTNPNAPAEEKSTPPLQQLTDDAPAEKSDALSAEDKPGASAPAIPAELAVRECRICKDEQAAKGEGPRKLRTLPSEVTQYHLFKKKGAPVRMCEVCDGEALEAALRHHSNRQAA